mgnify:CR=1 FL=1
MNPKVIAFLSFISLATMFSACNGSSEEETDENVQTSDTSEMAGLPFDRDEEDKSYLAIAHHVSDMELWRSAFELAKPVRRKYGISNEQVFLGSEDSTLALVFTHIENIDKAKEYVTSTQLETSMEVAGVKQDMLTFWIDQQLAYNQPANDTILMFMSFKVVNYERWEKAFLEDFKDGSSKDFEVLSVFKGIEENQVCMFFQVNDPEYVANTEKNAAFRMKMLAAGVISYPITHKIVATDI